MAEYFSYIIAITFFMQEKQQDWSVSIFKLNSGTWKGCKWTIL